MNMNIRDGKNKKMINIIIMVQINIQELIDNNKKRTNQNRNFMMINKEKRKIKQL